jgi:hypothetical protein
MEIFFRTNGVGRTNQSRPFDGYVWMACHVLLFISSEDGDEDEDARVAPLRPLSSEKKTTNKVFSSLTRAVLRVLWACRTERDMQTSPSRHV